MEDKVAYINYIPYKCMNCNKKITIKIGRCIKCAITYLFFLTPYCKNKLEQSELVRGICTKCNNLIIMNERKKTSVKEIVDMIDEDIYYQKKKLIGNYELDKPINWRIIGMEMLKSRIIT